MLPQKKFRSVHKYGKRRKAWNKGQTTAAAVPVAVPDGACSSSVTEPLLRPFADCCEAESVEGATSSYVRPPDAVDRDGRSREPDCGGTASAAVATPGVRASNILSRVSAQIPSSEEIAQRAQTRRDVLDAVASKSASKRKLELLNEGCDENDGGKDSTFFIVNKKMLNGLLSSVKCNKCDEGSIRLETTHCLGLAARMELFCDNCGIVNSAWSSPRCSGQQKTNPFEVNVRALRAVQSVGRKQSAINDIFSAMDISHRALHHKSYQRLQRKYSHPATTSAATRIEAESAQKVHDIYKDLGGVPGNIDVIYDGTWMTRGHRSHIGVGCVIELYTGLVLDHCVLSNYCQGCAVGPKPGDDNYEEWLEKHKPQCQKNTDANAGQMEVEAARIMFERSFTKYKLRYINVLCDGDSRTYLALTQDKVYGYMVIKKQECVNHVKKRMGTSLRNLLDEHKSKGRGLSMGGKGRLTQGLIKKLTNYYGWAIKSHPNDVPGMERAIMATYYHVTSTDQDPHHNLCPSGTDSWCPHNQALAKGEPLPPHKHKLPPHVRVALLPIYKRLSNKELLERCAQGKTQNAVESMNSLIWSLQSKSQFASLRSVESAVADAVCRFNGGCKSALQEITAQLGFNPGDCSLRRAAEKDAKRVKRAQKAHCSTTKKRKTGLRSTEAKATASQDYCPGGF